MEKLSLSGVGHRCMEMVALLFKVLVFAIVMPICIIGCVLTPITYILFGLEVPPGFLLLAYVDKQLDRIKI